MKNMSVNTIGFVDKKKLINAQTLISAGAAVSIIGGLMTIAGYVIQMQSQAWYHAADNNTMDNIRKCWAEIEKSMVKNG